jgi:hypothetical protein
MVRLVARAVVAAAAGLLAGALSVAAWYAWSPAFTLDFERDLPPLVSGLFRVERAGDTKFAWTSPWVALSLRGADRRTPWTCRIRVRGARPPLVPRAELTIAADGLEMDRRHLANDAYADVTVTIPARPGADGLDLALSVTPPFVPGPTDPRQLGAQLTAFSCAPDAGVVAPFGAIVAGGVTAAAFGAALAFMALPLSAAAAGALLVGIACGFAIAWGPGAYGQFPVTAMVTGGSIGAGMAATAWGTRVARRAPLGLAATAAIALSGGLLLVEALGLLHPSKTIVDAIFHAHRLEWVMEGRYLFTQPMPSGVRFPYAIALYVVSMPFGWIVEDHVALLKIVVLVSRALAGLSVYAVVARAWGDRRSGLVALCLFHAVPLPFVVIGNANLTYAFGQSVAVAAILAAALVGASGGGMRGALALFAIAALAFLSHVGIFPLLLAVLIGAAAGYAWLGTAALRPAAKVVAASAVLAAVFSVVVYYGHFGDAYRTLARVRAQPAAAATAAPAADSAPAPGARAGRQVEALSPGERVLSAAHLAVSAFGWPLLALAAAGAWVWAVGGWRDPLGLVIAATLGAAVVFEAGSVAAPVAPAFWRYTAEFISRVNFVAVPALVILAGRAAAAGWARGGLARAAAAIGAALAVARGAAAWLDWIL